MTCLALVGLALGLAKPSIAADNGPAIQGKNDWLFVTHEIVAPELAADAQVSLKLIAKLNQALAKQKIALVVAIVPSKIETYAEHLPDQVKVTGYMAAFNDQMHAALRSAGVRSIDLKAPFRNSPLRTSDTPLFFRLDTHWTPTGALLAAQTIHAGIQADPVLNQALAAARPEKYTLTWAAKKERESNINDIARLLPAGSKAPAPEDVLRFQVSKADRAKASLLLEPASGGDVALIGSSFSGDWSGFPNALRYTLQHDLVNFFINADVGPWYVMRSYLRDDAFQTNRPKLVIWELPERAISLPANYSFRTPRFRIDNDEWLVQTAALVQETCTPVAVTPKFEATGLLAPNVVRNGTATADKDFLEISLDKPVDHTSYLSARLTSTGSKRLTLETQGPGGNTRSIDIDVAGDENSHLVKTPLAAPGKTVNRVKVFPGNTRAFGLDDIDICSLPEDPLK